MNDPTKERGILMHARSVNGILAGRKTQTRRIVKRPVIPADWETWGPEARAALIRHHCPYGQPGDRLWVRETWAPWRGGFGTDVAYRAGWEGPGTLPPGKSGYTDEQQIWLERKDREKRGFSTYLRGIPEDGGWRPSLHMPRWASRITLEITDIRVERVQCISEADALAEGCVDGGCLNCGESSFPDPCGCASPEPSYRDTFISLWDDTNGEGAWDRNDWCWVVEFRRVEQ